MRYDIVKLMLIVLTVAGSGVPVAAQADSLGPPTASPGAKPTVVPDVPPSPSDEQVTPQAITLALPFALDLLETARLDDELVIRFAAVAEDSRCPEDVRCVWEGNAEISLVAAGLGRSPTDLSLNTNPGFPTTAVHLGYTIRLIGLEPYPRTDVDAPAPYRATLVVELDPEAGTNHLDL